MNLFVIQTDWDDDITWRGANELRRRSLVVRARPAIRLFGRAFPLGEWTVVREFVYEMPGPNLRAAAHDPLPGVTGAAQPSG